jgi:hypothetical protein
MMSDEARMTVAAAVEESLQIGAYFAYLAGFLSNFALQPELQK